MADRYKKFHEDPFYARQQNASRVLAIAWASVCPSVTLCSSVKTLQVKTKKSSPWAAIRTLVYCDEILCPWVRGFLSNDGVKVIKSSPKVTFCFGNGNKHLNCSQ